MSEITKSMKESLSKDYKEMNELLNKLEIKVKGMREYIKECEEALGIK